MTLSDIQNKIYSLTGTDSTSYPASLMLVDINIWLQKVVGMILDSQDEVDFDDGRRTDYPIKTIPLTTNRDYPIPTTELVLKVKDVSVAYDGTAFYRALPFNSAENPNATAVPATNATANTTMDAYFSRTAPKYSQRWNALWLYPAALATDVTAGGIMIVEWYRQALDFTSADLSGGTAIPGFDNTFHAMLAYGPAFEYCTAKSLPQAKTIFVELQDFEIRLRSQYSQKQNDRKYDLASDYQSYK